MPAIKGEIVFDQVDASFTSATIYVRLEDVSRADAPSRVIAKQLIHNVSLNMESPRPVPFRVEHDALAEDAMYTISVHVDVSGSGSVTAGDFITMESYPVWATQTSAPMRVRVRLVK